jgi:hypothetical protein
MRTASMEDTLEAATKENKGFSRVDIFWDSFAASLGEVAAIVTWIVVLLFAWWWLS